MERDIPLPPPRRVCQRTEIRHKTSTDFFHTKRLHLEDFSSHSSSDPPKCSSDDRQAASANNYNPSDQSGMKRKRHYRGTWWGEEVDEKRNKSRTQSRRNIDSGVWIGSDDSPD